jgi:hypothetical protein
VTVLGVDDFAIVPGRKYATVLIDAVTHHGVDAIQLGRTARWLIHLELFMTKLCCSILFHARTRGA